MGLALYRKYRSKSLDEIVGQSHITDMLRRSIDSGNIAHAYLLTGPKGVGKTSIARILAHEINKLPYDDESTHLDIIEIDAASNNSVEDIRDLRERVQLAPVSAAKKVYIIDEVHMLSKSAFNALLKTLEEPPEHVVFILATTDVEKLPATIVSRTQRFNFRMISVEDAVIHLTNIAKIEKIAADEDALRLIAEHSGGSFRDSISMLDQLQNADVGKITIETVERVMGLAPRDSIDALLKAYQTHDIATVVTRLNQFERQGTASSTLTRQLISSINVRVVNEPELLTLLDALLDTTRSAWPYVKLLTALAKPRRMLSPAEPIAIAPVAKLPTEKPVEKPAGKPVATLKKVVEKHAELPVEPSVVPAETTMEASPKPAKIPHKAQDFAWDDLLANLKEQAPGIYTILQNSQYTFDGTTLTVFAGKKFQKTQIDKSHALVSQAMKTVAPAADALIIIGSQKPPQDSQTAAILDIMGGGEQVSI